MALAEAKEQELIQVLKNCRLGQIRYNAGTDPKEVLRETERISELIARTRVITELSAKRERREREESIREQEILQDTGLGKYLDCLQLSQRTATPENPSCSPLATSNSTRIPISPEKNSFSLGDSIMTLNTTCPLIPPSSLVKELSQHRNTVDEIDSPKRHSYSSPALTPIRKAGYGIRNDPEDGEYDDAADAIALATVSPIHVHLKRALEEIENTRISKLEDSIRTKEQQWQQFQRTITERMKETEEKFRRDDEKRRELIAIKWKKNKLSRELVIAEKRKEQELYNQMKDKDLKTQKQLDIDRKRIEKEKIEAEAREAVLVLQKIAEAEESQRQKNLESIQAANAALKLEEQKRQQIEAEKTKTATDESSFTDQRLPEEFRGTIFYSDMTRYMATQDLIEDLTKRTAHITSTSPQTKQIYQDGIKVINMPLNQIGEHDLQAKITHFTNLLSGKPVQCPGMRAPFVSSAVTDGHLFIMNNLAYRFVKKSEAEVSENKFKNENLNYLAKLGVSLIKTFPEFGKIVQAYFYKLCPFLIPFCYPRGDMDIEMYAAVVGHEIKVHGATSEAAITQVLLARITGYCFLYGFMVKNFEAMSTRNTSGLKDMCSFFSSGEVWSILAKTSVLTPQIEVTATTVTSLLESMREYLTRRYQSQFIKALHFLKNHYIPRIHQATPPGKGGSLARLELLLRQHVK